MTSAPDKDGWIEHSPGPKPNGLRNFEARFRDGDQRRYRDGKHLPLSRCWLHQSYKGRSDIIAFRRI